MDALDVGRPRFRWRGQMTMVGIVLGGCVGRAIFLRGLVLLLSGRRGGEIRVGSL